MVQSFVNHARSMFSKAPPLLKASLTSGCIMMLGDNLAQRVVRKPGEKKSFDWTRSLRFGVVGATLHGPYFFSGMRAIDHKFGPAKTLYNAALKTMTAQAVLFPPFVALLFGYVGLWEGKTPSQCIEKVKANYVPAFKFGMVFWPAANIVNFRFLEPHQRLLYVSVMGLIWNTFISWMNAKKPLHSTIKPNAAGLQKSV